MQNPSLNSDTENFRVKLEHLTFSKSVECGGEGRRRLSIRHFCKSSVRERLNLSVFLYLLFGLNTSTIDISQLQRARGLHYIALGSQLKSLT